MTTEQAAASFNPDDASGLLDDARVKITKAAISTFTAKSGKNAGQTYVNLDVTFKSGEQDVTEHYMVGGSDQWAPNASKTGVIPVGREGGKLWNKSDVVKFWAALANAGFPKSRIGNDCSVIEGLDVHVKRVTTEGTYTDKEGKERQRAVLLVTKIYSDLDAKGAATQAKAGGAKQSVAKAASAAPATQAAHTAPNEEIDTVATDTLIELLSGGKPLPVNQLSQLAFVPLTKAKKSAIRSQVTSRIADPTFLGDLAEKGLIAFDGSEVRAAA